MTGRLALLMALGAVSACEAPPRTAAPAPPPAPAEPAAALSRPQIQDRAAQCARKAREAFRRDSGGGGGAAEFAFHYNTALDTCFYLLTVTRQETLSKKLLDVFENETYGEFVGPAAGEPPPKGLPASCRIESLYCASRGEWEILAAPYMRD